MLISRRLGVATNGIEPEGMHGGERERRCDTDRRRDQRHDQGLQQDAGEEDPGARADRLEHAVEADALDGDQGEEEPHHDERDDDGDPDDLVEDGLLLRDARQRVDRLRDRQRLRGVAGGAIDRAGLRLASAPATLTTSACSTPSPTRSPGRFAASIERHVASEPHRVPCPE